MTKILIPMISILFLSAAEAKEEPQLKVRCQAKGKVTLGLESAKSPSVKLHESASFKKGKLKGCAAVEKFSSVRIRAVPQDRIKNFKAAKVAKVQLPESMNGAEWDMSFDVVLFQEDSGAWVFGPVVLAEGYENPIENEILSASSTKVEVNQRFTSEGDSIEEMANFHKTKAGWKLAE